MERSVDRTLRLEQLVGPLRRRDVVRADFFQREDHMDPSEHQYAFFHLDLAARQRCQPISTRRDVARLQRAP